MAVLSVGAACGFLVLLAVGLHHGSGPTRVPPRPRPPALEHGKIGDTFTVNGVRVTLEQVIDPAHAAIDLTIPRAGRRYVALVFNLVNTSGNPATDSPNQLVSATDQQSMVLVPGFTKVAECAQNFNAGTFTLGRFEEQRGCVTLEVPVDSHLTSVRYDSTIASQPVAQWLLR